MARSDRPAGRDGGRRLGRAAEALVLAYFRRRGARPLARSWRSGRREIDLVLDEGGTVVFVEVKARRHPGAWPAVESLRAPQRARLVEAAGAFLGSRGLGGRPCRFDVVTVTWHAPAAQPEIEHLPNAFE